jgi:hypothetical protein
MGLIELIELIGLIELIELIGLIELIELIGLIGLIELIELINYMHHQTVSYLHSTCDFGQHATSFHVQSPLQ